VLKYELEIFTGNSWKSAGILFSWFVRRPDLAFKIQKLYFGASRAQLPKIR